MSDVPLHRLYRHYSELPYSQRVLYTATLLVLGFGYLFAMLNLFHTYAGRAGGNPLMLSYQDIVVAYSGSGKGVATRVGAARTDVEHAAARGGQAPSSPGCRKAPIAPSTNATSSRRSINAA